MALHRRGQLTQARTLYEQILARQPRHFDALHLLGVIAAQMKDPARAVKLIGAAVDIERNNPTALCNLGSAYKELDELEPALAAYDRAIALRPAYAEAHFNRSIVQRELKRWDAAIASCDAAISVRPDFAEAHCGRGKVFKELRQWETALEDQDRALVHKPTLVEAHVERGIALKQLGRCDEAMASYERAIALSPYDVHAHVNRGNLFKDLNQLDAALASFDRAISLGTDFATAHCNRSTILLLRGDFKEGWRDFEWRWQDKLNGVTRQRRDFPQAQWRGEKSIAGKTILLHHEQGLGDTLQFSRYAPLVAELGARVILQVPMPLRDVLTSLEGVSAVVAEGDPLPAFDCYCPLMSLPLAFGTTLDTIPARIPYLHSADAKTRFWQETLGEKRGLRVGLVWSGGFRPGQPEVWAVHNRRNIPLSKLAPLRHPDVEFYSLQKGEPAESELAALTSTAWDGPAIVDNTSLLRDFSDTAGLIAALDLVISVDTSTAHLAGALGKPVWLLNRFDTCWRWLVDRTDSPWYPTLRLYRQTEPANWDPVIERVGRDLAALVASAARDVGGLTGPGSVTEMFPPSPAARSSADIATRPTVHA